MHVSIAIRSGDWSSIWLLEFLVLFLHFLSSSSLSYFSTLNPIFRLYFGSFYISCDNDNTFHFSLYVSNPANYCSSFRIRFSSFNIYNDGSPPLPLFLLSFAFSLFSVILLSSSLTYITKSISPLVQVCVLLVGHIILSIYHFGLKFAFILLIFKFIFVLLLMLVSDSLAPSNG